MCALYLSASKQPIMSEAFGEAAEFSNVVSTLERIEAYVASARKQLECSSDERM